MKLSLLFWTGLAVAALPAWPAWAQQAPLRTLSSPATPGQAPSIDPAAAQDGRVDSTYREPLAGHVAADGRRLIPAASGKASLPVFPATASATENVSRGALAFAAKAAFSLAAARTGTATPVPAPSYPAYRPGMPQPEPAAEAIGCQPNGAMTTPQACAGR
ncbi:hypothetical protein ACXU4B_11150 [Dyella soli]|uniref:Uncharacterized protein n=1 Tax=Dyella soli TaxID=522319 RepID=A0A4R0YGB1_9GAMM|nr:hypothetical protein [Dyella soli]TCI07276.1 hypothetical protein EZM97_32270 [Dyella soli]